MKWLVVIASTSVSLAVLAGLWVWVQGPVEDAVVIVPTFTAAAYQPGGFYDYYSGRCDPQKFYAIAYTDVPAKSPCLTVPLEYGNETHITIYGGSKEGLAALRFLGFKHFVTDQAVTLDPYVLLDYKTIVVLHNEYVTRDEFIAITRHPNAIYLYPNSLYAEVSYNATANTIELLRGHGLYGIGAAFPWPPAEDTKAEYDNACWNWKFTKAPNGIMLSCYPEHRLKWDMWLWLTLKFAVA